MKWHVTVKRSTVVEADDGKEAIEKAFYYLFVGDIRRDWRNLAETEIKLM